MGVGDAALGKVKFVEQVLGFVDKSQWSILADHIIAADVKGTGQDGLYYFATWNSYDRNAERYSLTCMCDAWFEPRADFDKEHKYIVTRVTDYDDKYFHYGKNGTRWENSGQLNQVELMWWFGSRDAEWGHPVCRERPHAGQAPEVQEPPDSLLGASHPCHAGSASHLHLW